MFESETVRLLAPHLQWRTVVPKQGETVRGYVAGPLIVTTVHYVGKASKPCRQKLTKGELKCYCVEAMNSARQIGYLPIITQGREKLVILMCATTARKASLLPHTQEVEFWRPSKSKVGLAFKQLVKGELGDDTLPNFIKKAPHDIREYLWRVLWQDSELCSYFEKKQSASGPVCAAPVGALPALPPLVKKKKAPENASPVANIVQGLSDVMKAG